MTMPCAFPQWPGMKKGRPVVKPGGLLIFILPVE
jgi:hypothetical protein